jgi:2-amino-4-hydroxy-6-hydroxymethyldihydropteridine diphosphokinase
MPRVGIALGSNLGDRLANLDAACDCLRQIATQGEPFLQASIYQTEPWLCPLDSPNFYNSVVEIHFSGSAFELLEITQDIEKKLGRAITPVRNAPRIIDVDLLYFGDEIMDSERLILPHPRIAERGFVLQPLAEIRGELILPNHRQSVAEMLESLELESLIKIEAPDRSC